MFVIAGSVWKALRGESLMKKKSFRLMAAVDDFNSEVILETFMMPSRVF